MAGMRRLIRDISSVLIIAGVLLVLDAGVTLVWQEPVTAAIGLIQRSDASHRYLSYRSAPLSAQQRTTVASISSTRPIHSMSRASSATSTAPQTMTE